MWRVIAFVLLAAVLMLGVACGDSDSQPVDATSTPEPNETEIPRAANEGGEPPIFWRTTDDFASVRAGEPYKIVFRITGGYDEETISLSIGREGSDQKNLIWPERVEAGDGELLGSYYVTSLLLSEGTKFLTIVAGDDTATIQFDVAEAIE